MLKLCVDQYRHNNSFSFNILVQLHNLMIFLKLDSKCFITDNVNYLLSIHENKHCNDFFNNMISLSCIHLETLPTTISSRNSFIDNMFQIIL